MRLSAAAFVLTAACTPPSSHMRNTGVPMKNIGAPAMTIQATSALTVAVHGEVVEAFSMKYFSASFSEIRKCVEQAGYDLDLCIDEMVVPFIHESVPQLDLATREAIIRAIRVRFSNIKFPEKKRAEPRVDEGETMA